MTQAAPTRRRGMAARLWLAAVAVVLLGGCQTASGYIGTLIELDQAGIHNPSISSSGDQVRLAYDSTASPDELTEEENRAAEVIWRHLPLRFSSLEVDPRRGLDVPPRNYSRGELEGRFGPRPEGLDKGSGDIEQDFRNTWRNVVRGILIGVTTLLLLVVLVIVLVVRAVRRRGPATPPAGWPAAATPGPPPSWQGQPWDAQAPAGQQAPPPPAPWQPGAGQPGAPAPPPPPAWQPGTGQPAWQPPPAQPAWQPPPAPTPPTHEPTRKLDQPDEQPVDQTRQLDEDDAQETRRIPPDAARRPADEAGPDDETRPLRDQERGGPTPPP
ncbi:MAG TPA: hypothetical protein VF486_18335 [Actinomycetes bacterium]